MQSLGVFFHLCDVSKVNCRKFDRTRKSIRMVVIPSHVSSVESNVNEFHQTQPSSQLCDCLLFSRGKSSSKAWINLFSQGLSLTFAQCGFSARALVAFCCAASLPSFHHFPTFLPCGASPLVFCKEPACLFRCLPGWCFSIT